MYKKNDKKISMKVFIDFDEKFEKKLKIFWVSKL